MQKVATFARWYPALNQPKKESPWKLIYQSTEQNLIDIPKINKAGYEVKTFSYKNNAYFQQFGEFIPSMSSLDLLFNEGEQGRLILKSGISD